jgi:hypothetical protein
VIRLVARPDGPQLRTDPCPICGIRHLHGMGYGPRARHCPGDWPETRALADYDLIPEERAAEATPAADVARVMLRRCRCGVLVGVVSDAGEPVRVEYVTTPTDAELARRRLGRGHRRHTLARCDAAQSARWSR